MKKVFSCICLASVVMLFTGCQWPKIYIGDSQGFVNYDRLNHTLSVYWQSHQQAGFASLDSLSHGIDSITNNRQDNN